MSFSPDTEKLLNKTQTDYIVEGKAQKKFDSPEALWDFCLKLIKGNVNESAYNTWFASIKVVSLVGDVLTIGVESQFFLDVLDSTYGKLLYATIKEAIGENASLKYQVSTYEDEPNSPKMQIPAFRHPQSIAPIVEELAQHTVKEKPEFNTKLRSDYTFSNMIVGDCNRTAFNAAKSIVDNLGNTRFNPFFIYGNTGLGKTHLANAIGNEILHKKPGKKVLYTNSEEFSIEYVNAIKSNNENDFKLRYQSVDVLIVDDIQFMAKRTSTQETFFHIYNALINAGKQIIVVSDRPIKEVKDINERLVSRMQWGLTVQMQAPDRDMRTEILRRKSENEGMPLPEDVCEYIAKNVTSNIRELEGTILTILARHTFDNRNINLELAREIIEGIAIIEDKPLTVELIKQRVADYYHLTIDTMESKSRKHEIVLARQMSMYLIKELLKLPLKKIGSIFGGKDHTTVMHSCQTIDNYLQLDKTVRASYEYIKSNILER